MRNPSFFRTVVESTGILVAAGLVARALSILTAPILTRLLSPDDYGVAALMLSLTSAVGAIALFGLEIAYSRLYPAAEGDLRQRLEVFVWRAAATSGLIGGGVAAAIWLFASDRSAGLGGLAAFAFVLVPISVLSAMAQARSRALGRYRRQAVAVIFAAAASGIASIALAATAVGPGAMALVVGALVTPLVLLGALGPPRLRGAGGIARAERAQVMRLALSSAVAPPLFILMTSSDRWFLEHFRTTTEVGAYALTYSVATIGLALSSSLSSVWLTEVAKLHASADENLPRTLGVSWQRMYAFNAVACLLAATFAGDVLRILTPAAYHGVIEVIPWLAGAVFVYALYPLAVTGLYLAAPDTPARGGGRGDKSVHGVRGGVGRLLVVVAEAHPPGDTMRADPDLRGGSDPGHCGLRPAA